MNFVVSRNRFVNGELIVMTGLIDKRKVLCASLHTDDYTVCVCVCVCVCGSRDTVCM